MVKRAGGALLLSISIDPDSRRPVSIQLYVALRDLILSGGFAVGERLTALFDPLQGYGVHRFALHFVLDEFTLESIVKPDSPGE